MLTLLWDNDGVLVNTEGLYFQACQTVLKTVGVDLTAEQFKEISLRRGEGTLMLATEAGINDEEVARLRTIRNRLYAELLQAESCVVEGAEEVLGPFMVKYGWAWSPAVAGIISKSPTPGAA